MVSRLIVVIGLFAAIAGGFYLYQKYKAASQKNALKEAENLYQQSLSTQDAEQKSALLNQALSILLQAAPNAKVNGEIGTILADFREFPLAAYYLRQALKNDPLSQDIKTLLKKVEIAGNLPQAPPPKELLQLPNWGLAVVLIVWMLVILSTLTWPNRITHVSAILTSVFAAVLFSVHLYQIFINPIEGIIIHGTPLYHDVGGKELSTRSPLAEGLLVTVLDVQHNGEWIKVRTEQGLIGFVNQNAIRVLP